MKIKYFCKGFLFVILPSLAAQDEITPYKFIDSLPTYEIPASCRFVAKRQDPLAPEIVYYQSLPKETSFPIAILCEGSSDKNNIASVIHFHRYFLQEFMDLGIAVVTVEQWGVDGNQIDDVEFIKHYTRSQRLKDHRSVIKHLKSHPIEGWNGKFVFLGVSEGGPIVTSLTAEYANDTIATINWSGAGDWSWREELWVFLQKLLEDNPECPHSLKLKDCHSCSEVIISRTSFDALMHAILSKPIAEEYFLNMTYLYHADALNFPSPAYHKLTRPFLVVTGGLDTIIASSDAFVEKAKKNGANLTYLRIPNMNHYVRNRQDIIELSFEWLKNQISAPTIFDGLVCIPKPL